MDPSVFCGMFLGGQPSTRREPYSGRANRRAAGVTGSRRGCCWLPAVAVRHVFVVPRH